MRTVAVFIKDPNPLFPSGIAHDPTLHGWAVIAGLARGWRLVTFRSRALRK